MAEVVSPQEYWKGFPEAPASDTVKWIDKHGFSHMTTVRAWSREGLVTQTTLFIESIFADGAKPEGSNVPPAAQMQERDATGLPVVDPEGKPVMVNLPDGVHLFTVAGVFHDQNKDKDKDILKVVTVEKPYNSKYGVSCFHAPPEAEGWKAWPIGPDQKYAPPKGMGHVIIRDPQSGGKYAEIVEFKP